LRRGEPPVVFGGGEQTRDFVPVATVVEANLRSAVAKRVARQVFNVASGHSVSLNELLRPLAELLGMEVKAVYEPEREGDIRHSAADVSAAQTALSLDEPMSLKEGLMRTIGEENL
jgi:nucleoside-diphosphate-sugar epimerase